MTMFACNRSSCVIYIVCRGFSAQMTQSPLWPSSPCFFPDPTLVFCSLARWLKQSGSFQPGVTMARKQLDPKNCEVPQQRGLYLSHTWNGPGSNPRK
eukprot:m.211766 g.211766  ORF g.211766 m.211766 type:complete len:97 (+) comp18578_c0_seq4:885-1175(+)